MSLFSTPKRFLPDDQVPSYLPLSTQVLKLGRDHAVSFTGTSQFTAQGVSACGLAAFNFARIGFRLEKAKQHLPDILNELSTRDTVEEIVAICAGWSSNMHLEVEDIYNLPVFSRSLRPMYIEYGFPSQKHFQTILENMGKLDKSAVMIITRPPEIIACFRFIGATDSSRPNAIENPLYVVFDSHPRPSHPNGAGISFSTSIENTARTLSESLPVSIFDMDELQWQAQLLSNCSAHVYVGIHRRKDNEDAVIQSSLSILTLRAQIAELRRENEILGEDKQQLQSEVGRLRAAVREEEATQQVAASSFPAYANQVLARSFGLISHAVPGPSRSGGVSSNHGTQRWNAGRGPSTTTSRTSSANPWRPFQTDATSGASSIFANNPPPIPYQPPPTYDDLGFDLDFDDAASTDSDALWRQSTQVARDLQNQFDSEDRRLRWEQEELIHFAQSKFQCGICMDELPVDDVAKVDNCVHTMCRSCLREYVASKLREHRYPILCPMCVIVEDGKKEPGVISRLLIEELGASEEQIQILFEMELAEYTVQIHCRKCKRPASVDREDYSDMINIVCPHADCTHIWCKKCDQTIVIDGPKHSCDGTNELDHLMKQKGWKHCPTCKTPIQKDSGCNHMTCISPGCNTHFCYICGGMIVRSTLNNEINQQVSAHFNKCQLFEVPE